MIPAALPDLIVDALSASPVGSGKARAVCVPFALPADVISAIVSRSDVASLITILDGDAGSTGGFAKAVVPFSASGKPDPAAWQSAQSLLFVGFGSGIPYGMLTSALRAGIKSVICLAGASWKRQPTWRLLAERHLRSGLLHAPYRMAVHRLDQYGARSPAVRTLAKALNGGRSISRFVSSLPAQANPDQGQGIAFYTGSLGSGGAERQMVNTILALKERGYGPIRVACAGDADGFYRPILDAAGIAVETVRREPDRASDDLAHLSVDQLRRVSDLPREVVMEAVALSAWLQQAPPRVLHCWQDHCNVVGGLAGLLSGVPRIVLSTRSLAPYNFGFFQLNQRPAYRALATRPEVRILNNSAMGADDYAAWLGVRRSAFEVIRNGVDLSKLVKPGPAEVEGFRSSLGIPAGAPVMGTIFTIYKYKRPLLWVDTAAALARSRPDAHFLMVGDGPMRQETEERIARHGLTDRFHLPGRMEDVALALSAMQAFLLTSVVEGLPNVLLEAQMMGVPAVTVNVGGAGEAIDDGKTGLVVNEAMPEKLAEAILSMLADAQQTRSATLGPEFVRTRFGMTRMIDETLASYGLAPLANSGTPRT